MQFIKNLPRRMERCCTIEAEFKLKHKHFTTCTSIKMNCWKEK